MDQDTVIKLENVSKTYLVKDRKNDTIRDRVFNAFKSNPSRHIEAVKSVNLEVKRGEFFSIIGRNGSGKSTLLNMIMGALQPNKGSKITVDGKMIKLALGMGFNPNMTGRENILINGSILGLTLKEIRSKIDEIIAFAELDGFIDTLVRHYSSGMRARLTFSVALHAKADIFLFDEFFGGVGDLIFKKKSDAVFQKSLVEGKTIVLITHSLEIVKKHSDRALLIDNGDPIIMGKPELVIKKYRELAQARQKARLESGIEK